MLIAGSGTIMLDLRVVPPSSPGQMTVSSTLNLTVGLAAIASKEHLMQRLFRNPVCANMLGLLTVLGGTLAWGEEEVEIIRDQVPAAALAVMVKAAGASAVSGFVRAQEDGKTVYSAEFTTADGILMEITASPEGALIAVEKEVEDPAKTEAPEKPAAAATAPPAPAPAPAPAK
jgi:hypothetical protein